MSRLALVTMLCCAAGPAALAQDDAEAKQAAYGQLAFEDMVVIDLFLDLGLDNGQASRMQSTIREAARKAEVVKGRLAAARQAAMNDMFKVRDALLAGRTVVAADVPQWMQLKEVESATSEQLTAIWDEAYQNVVRRLTREQQARLAPAADPLLTAEDAAAERLEQQRLLAQQQQGVGQTVLNLMAQARRTVDPDRFRANAPLAIAQATAGLTGLAPDHPLLRQLNQFFYTRLTQLYQLQPAPYAQARAGVAAELSRATMYVIAQTLGAGEGAPVTELIDPARLQQAIRYERAPVLLGEYADNYRDPLAREGGERADGEGDR